MSTAASRKTCYEGLGTRREKRPLARPSRINFSENLSKILDELGLNYSQFARDLTGVTSMTVGRWLRGEAEPSFEDKDRLAEFLRSRGVKVTVSDLYMDPTEPSDPKTAQRLRENHLKQLEQTYRKLGIALGLEKPTKDE